jgi:outer membrane receptor protein involved in Fe transport
MRWSALVLLATLSAPLMAQQIEPVEQQVALGGPRFLRSADPEAGVVDPASVAALQRRVSLTARELTLAAALSEITRQTGIRFLLSRDVVPLDRPVRVEATGLSLAAVMTELLLNAHVDVAVVSPRELALVRRREAMVQDSGAVVGRVTDAKTGEPLVGATVVMAGTPGGATTGDDGRYRIAGVPEGTYTVRVRYIGYAPATVPVTVSANAEVTADIALERSAQKLDEVVSTGTVLPTEVRALPTPVTVITAEDIALRHPHSLAEVVRQAVPSAVGFDPPGQPYSTEFSARGASGLTGGGMKIIVDGIEASKSGYSTVDPSSIERIEVIRGPQAATIYGPDAAGGVIQIFTKRGVAGLDRPRIDASAAMGVAQTPYDGFGGVLRQEYSGSVRGGAGNMGYNFGGSYFHLANFVPGEITPQSMPSVFGGMHYARGMLTADVSARYKEHVGASILDPAIRTTGIVAYSKPQYSDVTVSNETYGARFTLAPNGWLRNQLTLGVDRNTISNNQIRPRFTTPGDSLLTLYQNGSRKLSVAYNLSATGTVSPGIGATLSAGVDHYSWVGDILSAIQALNSVGTIAIAPGGSVRNSHSDVRNTGVFAQLQLDLRESVYLTAGLRADDNSNFGDELGTPVLPRVGLSMVREVGGATIKARVAYGEAFRAPQFGASTGVVSATSITLSNPSLAPEQQQGWDAGLDLVFGDRWSLSVTGYDQTARDLIAYVQLASVPVRTYQYLNVGRVKNRGLEVEGTLNFTGVQLRAQYAYARSRIDELAPPRAATSRWGTSPRKYLPTRPGPPSPSHRRVERR